MSHSQKYRCKLLNSVKEMLGLSEAELRMQPMCTLDQMYAKVTEIASSKSNKLALRKLVDAGRAKVWKLAQKMDTFDEKSVSAWVKENRKPGQTEFTWKLRVQVLNTLYPTWMSDIKLDADLFATLDDACYYGNVLCGPAHDATVDEQLKAVSAVDEENRVFYEEMFKFVHENVSL